METINNQNETWKKIPGYDGYEASTLGRIRNSNTGTIYKQAINKKTGYCSVGFWDSINKKPVTLLVHRLVLMTFNPTSDETLIVDHINNNRTDCRLENLRWVTIKENNSKGHARKLKSRNSKSNQHIGEYIKAEKGSDVVYFKNQREAAKYIGCSHVLIVQALKGYIAHKAKGWTISYVPASECPELTKRLNDVKNEKIQNIKNERTQRKLNEKNTKIEYKKTINERKAEMKNELKKKVAEYNRLQDKSRKLLKEIKTLKKNISELTDKKVRWDLHAVIQMTMDGEFVREWKTVSEIGKELGLNVRDCVLGKKESIGGYKWEYKIAR